MSVRQAISLGGKSRGAASPVGTILMVALAVILATILANMVFGLVDVSGGALAGANVKFQDDTDSIRVIFTETHRDGTYLTVTIVETASKNVVHTVTLSEVGDSVTWSGSSAPSIAPGIEYRITVVAHNQEDSALVTQQTGYV